jgi:hypothetical protein
MNKRILILITLLGGFMFSCTEESNPTFDTNNFTSIFDNSQFDASYFPIDIRQTPDGGYLVLGGRKLIDSNFTGIYLLKADKFGKFVTEIEVEESSVNPIAKFAAYQDKYYFFCMDAITQEAQLVDVDADLSAVNITPVEGGLTYPAASSFEGDEFVLLSYNDDSKESVISLISVSGALQISKGYTIGTGEDIEEPIINHFIRTGRQYPFEVGRVAGSSLYYFNGFFDYTFSLVFTNISSDDPIGVVQGQQDDGGFSAVTSLGGSKFASARFNFGDNYLLPNKDLSTSGNTISTDLGGYSLPEMVENAKVKILRASVDSKNVLIYGTDTKTKQIGLLFYDEAAGTFISSRYLGFSNPFEIASLTQTADGGLAVCGTTYLAGRFPRICIFKLSKDKLAENVN